MISPLSARPEVVQSLFDETVAIGAQFGVIMVIIDGDPFEVATFRADAAYVDGRRPSAVHYGTIEEDVRRRDFTIGGMYFDPAEGRVIDLVGGMRDLRRGVIRAIGNPDERFREDHLRLLRAIRFAARLDFTIEPATWRAIQRDAPSIKRIAAERIGEELVMIMTEGGAARGLDLLVDSGLAAAILPEVLPLKGCEQPANYHPEGDVYRHTRLMLSMLPRGCTETLAFGTLLHDIAKPPTPRRHGRGQNHLLRPYRAGRCDRRRSDAPAAPIAFRSGARRLSGALSFAPLHGAADAPLDAQEDARRGRASTNCSELSRFDALASNCLSRLLSFLPQCDGGAHHRSKSARPA